MQDAIYEFGEFRLDAARFQLTRSGERIRLEKKPMELLLLLAASEGKLVTRAEIAAHLWGSDVFVDTEHGINTAVRKVRAALGEASEHPQYVLTVSGMGYRFVAPSAVLVSTSAPGPALEPSVPPAPPPQAAPHASATPPPGSTAPIDAALHPVLDLRQRLPPKRTLFTIAAVVLAAAAALAARQLWHGKAGRNLASSISPSIATPGSPSAAIPLQAREQYQRGLFLLDRRSALASADAFREAIRLAPDYAPAYAGLAQALDAQAKLSNGVPGTLVPEAVAAAKRAIALDPDFDGGYIALGMLETAFTWQWTDAERNLTRGLRINPANAVGHIWYAVLLQSRQENRRAIEEARLAGDAAPLSFFMVRMQGSVAYFARDYDSSMRFLTRAQEMTPQHPNVVDNWISWVDEQRGLYDGAIEHDLLVMQQHVTPSQIQELRQAYAQTGWKGYWRTRLQILPPAQRQGCQKYEGGLAALRSGDRDLALGMLRDAAEQHCFWLGMIHVDPAIDSLRSDPRFHSIEQIVDSADADAASTAGAGTPHP